MYGGEDGLVGGVDDIKGLSFGGLYKFAVNEKVLDDAGDLFHVDLK